MRRGEVVEFLQVSNFVEKKGHCYTVRAFRELLEVYPNCRLTLAGDGNLRSAIEILCGELGIKEKVRFVGKVTRSEVPPIMASADIFVHHSVTAVDGDKEGIPTVLMEAMATGLIPVSTLHAGIPELITDGIHGFLSPEKDIQAYVTKLKLALACREEICRAARRKVEEDFNLNRQNQKLNAIYQKVIDGHR
jgi:glycosyltransferase involved in cell wall biosynthesis